MDLIRLGDRGARVLDVQAKLAALGYAVPASERGGTFGDGTLDAVRAFQQSRGILVDGIVGADTWRELIEASRTLGDRVLYLRAPHMRGDDVRQLQDKLATFGLDAGRPDGIFGPQTQRGVLEFQRNYGMKLDGIVAEETVRALKGLPAMGGDTPAAGLRERMRRRPGGLAGLRMLLDPGSAELGDEANAICAAIVRRLEPILAAAGAAVFVPSGSSCSVNDPQRAALANALDADVYVAIRTATGEPQARGAAAFYFGHERFHSETGARLAELALQEICALGLVDARTHAKTFPVLRETRMTAVVIEPGHFTNPEERALLEDTEFRARLADALARAVRRFAEEP